MSNNIFDQFLPPVQNAPLPEYGAFLAYAKGHRGITYDRFDGSLVREINLFAIREELDFKRLDTALDRMISEIPTIKRILSKPIIRLKDSETVLPVEAVRLIDNRTLVHASVHSELWESRQDGSMKPRRLMTLQNEDQYAIYENMIVVKAVDCILEYVSSHIRLLNDLLYTDRNMQFNLLERINHLSYFLAMGKLHVGYVRDYDQYRLDAERCLKKLLYLDRVLRARLGCKLYWQCHKLNMPQTLQKTNIFRMQKDYHRIFLLMKWFDENDIPQMALTTSPQSPSGEGYRVFGTMLTLFAIGHFNFVFDPEQGIDFESPDQHARFREWSLSFQQQELEGIRYHLLTVNKEESYRVVLIFSLDPQKARTEKVKLKELVGAEEYLVLTPDAQRGMKEEITVSLYDVESFRRLQQILLRAMVYADTQREDCPFCGNPLSVDRESGRDGYLCGYCRTQIFHQRCEEKGERYAATAIYNYKLPERYIVQYDKNNRMLRDRQIEAALHFRNITPINDRGELRCPFCSKKH